MTDHELDQLADLIATRIAQSEPALLDAQGAAAILSVPPSWVLAEARADRIPHVKLGRYVRFERNAITDWLRAR